MNGLLHHTRVVAWNAACLVSGSLQLAFGQSAVLPLFTGGR